MNQPIHRAEGATRPGERLLTQFSTEQRGWMGVALVAFLGVAIVGPAIAMAAVSGRKLKAWAGDKVRQAGLQTRRSVAQAREAGERAARRLRR